MCRRFDTIPTCDGRTDRRTDGIAVASTALAMRRAVKTFGGRVTPDHREQFTGLSPDVMMLSTRRHHCRMISGRIVK